jgi:uncharacterized membrane protein YebE (DUF533 family)
MDSMKILRLWAACAWADGTMHPAEAAAIERLISASDDLSADERGEATRFLTAAPDVDLAEVRELPPVAREGVYRAARGIVRLDRQVTPDEETFLERLRGELDLDAAAIERIEAE